MFRRLVGAARGTRTELDLMGAFLLLGVALGNIGGIGIVLSGAAITTLGTYPWLDFGAFPWLATKQVLYGLILLANFALVVPGGKKMRALLVKERAAASDTGASDALRDSFRRLSSIGLVIQVLVLLALVLGAWKPSL